METDDKIWSLHYCPCAPLRPHNVHPVSNGPIRRDATRHKVLSHGFRETSTEVEVPELHASLTASRFSVLPRADIYTPDSQEKS